MAGLELSSQVSTKEPYFYGDENAAIKVACIDYGIKRNIIRNLAARGVYCKVFPAKASLSEMESWNPDAYFLSNGPGDPAVMYYAVATNKEILTHAKPLYRISLGHLLLARVCDVSTYKMLHVHKRILYSLKNLFTGKSDLTSQNQYFNVTKEDVEKHPGHVITH